MRSDEGMMQGAPHSDEDEMDGGFEIAIIGLALRMPGARHAGELWNNLAAGVESITFFGEEELLAAGVAAETMAQPGFVAARGVLDDAEGFDASFFDINPRDAEIMDPQQRLFLECVQEALEDAGVDPDRNAGLIGLFAGCGPSSHLARQLADPKKVADHGLTRLLLANDKDFLCTRVAYRLGLRGPAITVQTACSSSLVAVHVAGQALLNGECDLALAGGVSVSLPQAGGTLYQEGGILSPDGHCRTFDAEAKGSVSGHGVGVVMLKRLEDALADGDTVRAVIKGSATNNDGSHRIGFTAPGQEGQAAVVRAAQQMAGVEARSITYVEAHGTATELGDPIELAALTDAWRADGEEAGEEPEVGTCAIGSIKTNLGHLDAAAGVAGLIKAVLALEHRQLPPSLHYTKPNPRCDFAHSPFYVNTELRPWPAGSTPRRAGVSSFGLGGTNAHVVLEEAPAGDGAGDESLADSWQLLPLSGRTASAADAMVERLAEHMRERPEQSLAEVAGTLQLGRRRFDHRRVVVARRREEAVAALRGESLGRLLAAHADPPASGVVFLLSGLGEQYVDMGLGLYRSEPVFRREIDRCAEILRPESGLDLRQILYPRGTESPQTDEAQPEVDLRAMLRGDRAADPETEALEQIEVLHPSLFVLDYALAQLWISWGVQPAALLGYSLGEYVAACLAGVFSLEDALGLVTRRARLIGSLPHGGMLAVPLAEEVLRPRLGDGISIAAINGSEMCVLSGEAEVLAQWAEQFAEEGIPCREIATSHAFHSSMMRPIADTFRQWVAEVPLKTPRVPYVSNVSGDWIRPEEAVDPDYWVRHLCEPVRFADALATLCQDAGRVFLEVGPGQALTSMCLTSARPTESEALQAFASLPSRHQGQDDLPFVLNTLGRLWLTGLEVDWESVGGERRRRRVPLPTYPFEHQQFVLEHSTAEPPAAGVDGGQGQATLGQATLGQATLRKCPEDLASWFFLPSFKRVPLTKKVEGDGRRWLLLGDGGEVGRGLVEGLRARGHQVTRAIPGKGGAERDDREVHFDPCREEEYDALLARVEEDGALPEILHVLTLGETAPGNCEGTDLHHGFLSLLWLCEALGRSEARLGGLTVISHGLLAVERGDRLRPDHAMLLGPLKVSPQEMPQLVSRLVDVDPEEASERLLPRLLNECTSFPKEPSAPHDPLVAWRGPHRWVPAFESLHLAASDEVDGEPPSGLRRGGVYLITGGLGGLGLALAEHLVRRFDARLALLGRSGMPSDEDSTDQFPANNQSETGRQARWQALKALGGDVLVLEADVAEPQAMAAAVEKIEEHFGTLHGVFHLAGVPGQGLMQLKTAEEAAAVLRPKVLGLQVLQEVLAGRSLDLIVLYSSIASVVGAIGQVDYAAANAYLDAWAEANPLHARRCLAIDWGEWRWDGWSATLESVDPRLAAELAKGRAAHGLTTEDGLELLERALESDLPRVVVSTRDFRPLLARRGSPLEALGEVKSSASGGARHPRPTLGVPLAPPGDVLEEELVALWQDLLGLEQVGIDDPFLEIGGHSLLALQLLTRLRSSVGASLPLRAIFEASTIRALAERIRGGEAPTADEASIPRLERTAAVDPSPVDLESRDLENLSGAELDALLQELQGEGEP